MSTNGDEVTSSRGEAASSLPSIAASGKRKRSDSNAGLYMNGKNSSRETTPTSHVRNNIASQGQVAHDARTVVDILAAYDTPMSMLRLPLNVVRATYEPTSPGSRAKRPKLTGPSLSISSKAEEDKYISMQELLQDVEDVVKRILVPMKSLEAVRPTSGYAMVNPLPLEDKAVMAQAIAFRKVARTLISSWAGTEETEEAKIAKDDLKVKQETSTVNGIEEVNLVTRDETTSTDPSVLTLWANAQGPRQLFSSLQKPMTVSNPRAERLLNREEPVDIHVPIREDLLPDLLSTTNIIATEITDDRFQRTRYTIGDRFQAPPTVPQLLPPKHTKTTAGSSIVWDHTENRAKTSRNGSNYTKDKTSIGQWLGYRGAERGRDISSPEARRKQRDRALSTGEAQPLLSEENESAAEQAREEALFRSAYSSFAPTRDDSAAIIPTQVREQMWWEHVGKARFHSTILADTQRIDPDLLDDTVDQAESVHEPDETALGEMIADLEAGAPTSLSNAGYDHEKDDTESLLKEVSDLLESLNSYQRIRNASLTSHAHNRTPSLSNQQATMTNLSGSPTNPTAAELDVYSMLKLQLSIIVQQLPPFAVAKLDGERLAELNISKTILVESENSRGCMEEDQLSRTARINATASHPAAARASTGSSAQFQRPLMSRNSSSLQQRSATGQFQSPYGSSTPRVAHNNTPAYAQTSARPTSSATNYNSTQQYYSSTGPTRQPTQLQNYGNTTQLQARNYQQQATNASYPSRSYSNGPTQGTPVYGYGSGPQSISQAPQSRNASPLKAMAPQQSHSPSRPQYQTSNSTAYAGTHMVGTNGQNRPSHSALTNGTGYGGTMSTPAAPN